MIAALRVLLPVCFLLGSAATSADSKSQETGPPAVPESAEASPERHELPGISQKNPRRISIDGQPPDPLAPLIADPPVSDRMTIGRVDGLAEFRDSQSMIPDAFSRLDSPYAFPPDSELTPSPIVPKTPVSPMRADSRSDRLLSDSAACSGNPPAFADRQTRDNRPVSISSTAVFSNAAHFAYGSSGGCQGLGNVNPVMIYEGMTVTLSDSGAYEVRWIAEAPDLPVMVRMQLNLQQQGIAIGTITLPPVVLSSSEMESASRRTRLPNETRSWLVRRTGYSHAVAGLTAQDRQRITVTRSGTVQIGQMPHKPAGY